MGRGGGPSGPGGAVSVSDDIAGGFAVAGGSFGSLSSIGRDQGSIGPERERELRSLERSGLDVEEDEAMSANSAAGVVAGRDRRRPSSDLLPRRRPRSPAGTLRRKAGWSKHYILCTDSHDLA